MMHRRKAETAQSGSISLDPSPQTPSQSAPVLENPQNQAYTPLRRQSANFYNTPSSAKPRYDLPSPSAQYIDLSSPPVFPGHGGDGRRGSLGYGLGVESTYDLSESKQHQDGVMGVVRAGIDNLRKGLRDAARLERSWGLVWGDRELRTLVIKSTLINLLSLLLLSLTPLILSPLFLAKSTSSSLSPDVENRTKEIGMWYNLLLSWPVFIVCFWVNASWAPDISKRAQTLLHPTYRHQPSPSSTPTSTHNSLNPTTKSDYLSIATTTITRILLISDFTLISRLILLIPLIGPPSATAYMSLINAYYFFEYTFVSKNWPLEARIAFMQNRVTYMIGFGFVATVITSFGPPLVNMALFALLYPFFVIQALQAKPPPASTNNLLLQTPSPYPSRPSSPANPRYSLDGNRNPFSASPSIFPDNIRNLRPQVPIFFLAKYALEGLRWLEEALLRDRGGGLEERRRSYVGKERSGKRLM